MYNSFFFNFLFFVNIKMNIDNGSENYKLIPVYKSNDKSNTIVGHAKIDDDDFLKINSHTWKLYKNSNYPQTSNFITLHGMIMGQKKSLK